jgi:N-glycosylase/DNA lyase
MDREIDTIIAENTFLKTRVLELEARLKKYTNSEGHKRYYEKNKDRIIKNANTYLKKLSEDNPEKLKEYRRRAYVKRREGPTASSGSLPLTE